jgi:hypothetical protein
VSGVACVVVVTLFLLLCVSCLSALRIVGENYDKAVNGGNNGDDKQHKLALV